MLAIVSTLAISLFAVVMIVVGLNRRRRANDVPLDTVSSDALDTVGDWPPQAVRVMTLEERQAYDVLRRALPKHLILAQVPLARFISVPTSQSYVTWLQKVGRLSVDLLVTDAASSRPIAAVEIHSASETARSKKRHARMAAVLEAAGIPVHVWTEDELPSPDEAYRQIRKEPVGHAPSTATPSRLPKSPAAVAATTMPSKLDMADAPDLMDDEDNRVSNLPLPVAEVHELLAEGDLQWAGQSHDPVASTFFDELDVIEPELPTKGKRRANR